MRNRIFPKYPDDTDYNTNAPSYYDDLARKQKLIELLAKKIWEYEETLDLTLEEISNRLESYIDENDNLMTERLEQWDLNLEKFPENVELLLQEWLSDGTLDHIINDTIFNWKLDTSIFEQFRDSTTAQLQQTETDVRYLKHRKNVLQYGVAGDGVTDDWDAMQTLLDEGGALYIPSGIYFFSRRLEITSHTDILGDRILIEGNAETRVVSGTVLQFDIPESDLTAINIGVGGRHSEFKSLYVENISGVKNVDGISTNTTDGRYVAHIKLEDVWVNYFKDGFYLPTLTISEFSMCYASYNINGFHCRGLTTATNFIGCYALDNEEIGWVLHIITYSTLTSCASDGSKYAYWLKGGRSIQLNACGSENIGICSLFFEKDNKGVSVNDFIAYGTGQMEQHNLATLIHIPSNADNRDIIINNPYEYTNGNPETRTSSIVFGGSVVGTLNNPNVVGSMTVGANCLWNGQYISSAQPSEGTHRAGKVVWNANSSSGLLGWKCYLTGTPGEWHEINNVV